MATTLAKHDRARADVDMLHCLRNVRIEISVLSLIDASVPPVLCQRLQMGRLV